MIHTVAQHIAETARALYDQATGDTGAVLSALVTTAVAEIPGAQQAGMTLMTSSERIETGAVTGLYASVIEEIHRQTLEGPCLTADLDGHRALFVDDIATERRWRCYRREVIARTPIRAIMSYQLFTGNRVMGALNVYAERAHAFDSEAKELGLLFATHAALAWDAARRDDQFRTALSSRDLIGQAKGVLIERFDIDATAAFELLRRLSQETNTPLHDIARRLVTTPNFESVKAAC